MNMINLFFILAIVMQFKHLFADYFLQTGWMLGKFKESGWALPLAAHAGVHFLFTFIIAGFFLSGGLAAALALLDFSIHFVMDRIKASPKLLGRFEALSKKEYLEEAHMIKLYRMRDIKTINHISIEDTYSKKLKSNVYFWWSLGLDQMVHHLTDLTVVFILIKLI